MMREVFTIHGTPRVVHADRGTSMTSKTVAALLTDLGVTGLDAAGQVSVVTSLPRGSMAAIFDVADIANQIATSLRLAGSLQLIRSSRVAIAVGIEPTMMLAVGTLADLLRANSVSLRSNDAPVRVEADEAVTLDALDTDADAVAATAARLLAARVSAHN